MNKTIESIPNRIIKKSQNNLIKALSISKNEKDVENAWREWFNSIFDSQISSPYGSDGVIDTPLISCILEFKFDKELSSSFDCAKILVQILFYLKKIQEAGQSLPKAIFVGDVNECFIIETNAIIDYLKYDLDWSIPPSSAATINTQLVIEMAKNEKIVPFVYNIHDKFDTFQIIHKIANITANKPVAIPITSKNIVTIFEQFKKIVLKNTNDTTKYDFVDIFFKALIQNNDVYLHPKKDNVLCIPNGEIPVNARAYRAFFSSFRQNYTSSELEDLTANKDQILDEERRRRTGAFFTPQIWVDYAHKMMEEQFGTDWKEKYVVWDPCCGTANLTRGYKFKELYLSTLEFHDIEIIKSCGYNPEATVFQYDFLSEVGFGSIPEGLKKALNEGRVIVFINPPYGTASNIGKKGGDNKAKIADTIVGKKMKKENIGASSQQLYAQFLWKLWQNDKIIVAVYSKPAFMISPSFDNFRDRVLREIEYKDGIMFRASHFADVSGQWGVSFTIWDKNIKHCSDCFEIGIADVNKKTSQIEIVNYKQMCPVKKENRASFWVRKEVEGKNTFDFPQMTSAIGVKQSGCLRGRLVDKAFGYFFSSTNAVYANTTDVGIFSSCAAGGHGLSVIEENIHKVAALFTARRTITGKFANWINDKDEYSAPNEFHPDYQQWNNDCFVYFLFEYGAQQSSLRQIDYKGKKWDILNHFFFMSCDEMMNLANNAGWHEMYQMAKAEEDRYVYKLLESMSFSPDAKDVLETARDLVRKSFTCRQIYHQQYPKYHLHAWDAGWAQMKPMLKENFAQEYKDFVAKFKKFEDRMREGVYKFGFLQK